MLHQIWKIKPLEEKALILHPSSLAVFSCPLLFQARAIEPEQETAEPTGEKKYPFCVKSLAAELLDWLTVGLKGARAKGKCGNVAKGGGMWFGSPVLQFNFAYIEELHTKGQFCL